MKSLLASLGLFFFCVSAASADTYWTDTVRIPQSGYFEIEDPSFHFFSFALPDGGKVEIFDEGAWRELEIDDENDPFATEVFHSWAPGRKLALRFSETIPPKLDVDFSYIKPRPISRAIFVSNTTFVEDLPVVSREGWGADESWRYDGEREASIDSESRETGKLAAQKRAKACSDSKDYYPDEFELEKIIKTEDGNALRWPYQYSKKIRKVVVHHTAETGVTKGLSADQVVRGIYRYHTVSRSWGDIGYHYLVAPDGTIFEGKAGGDFVVGGHVYCNNIGTIGVALMGNFEEHDPTPAQITALGKLLPRLAKKYELDLTDTEQFHGKETPNLIGHRDLGPTACPGKNMYSQLPILRKVLDGSAEILFARQFKVDGEPADKRGILQMKPGETKKITLAFRNTGNANWDKSTWLFARAGDGVAVDSIATKRRYVAGRQKEDMVRPGETAHFDVRVTAEFWGGVSTVSFVPVVRNKRVHNAETLQVFEIEQPDFGAKVRELRTKPDTPVTGKGTSLAIDLQNTGKTRWKRGDISLAIEPLGNGEPIILPLQQTTPGGQEATFRGRLPAFLTPGDKILKMNLLLGEKRIIARLLESITVTRSENKAVILDAPPKISFAKKGEAFEAQFSFENTGNVTWEADDLELKILQNRKFVSVDPEDKKDIAPGEEVQFTHSVPVSSRVGVYLAFLKDGTQTLEKKLFLVRGLNVVPKALSGKTSSKKESQQTLSPMCQKLTGRAFEKLCTTSQKTEEKKEVVQKEEPKEVSKSPEKQPASDLEEEQIRIRISFPYERYVKIGGTFFLYDAEGNNLGRKKEISIVKSGNSLFADGKESRVFRATALSKTPLEVRGWDRYPAWDSKKKWNDNIFLGTIEIRLDGGELVMINELSLGEYLLGLGETLEADPFEKKKAIAVIARSYAAHYMSEEHRKFPGKKWDGSDSPAEFQKYLGSRLTERSPEWQRALAETAGEVLVLDSEIIKTPFHTCSGGQTESAEDKWGWKNTPYLPSVDDPGGVGKSRAGHGVGLSGCGAKYFADQGKTYREILEYYYPGLLLEAR